MHHQLRPGPKQQPDRAILRQFRGQMARERMNTPQMLPRAPPYRIASIVDKDEGAVRGGLFRELSFAAFEN
jgi:hypothetical protein